MVLVLLLSVVLNFAIVLFFLEREKKTERARERERNQSLTERAELLTHIMTLKGYRNQELKAFVPYQPPQEQEPDEEENNDPWESL